MRAVIFEEYGPPELLREVERDIPVPKDDEVLIKVHAATVTAGDCEMRRFEMHPLFWLPVRLLMGWKRPKKDKQVLGQEFAGVIEQVGKKVTNFKVGDRVFGGTGIKFGAYAEYRCQKATYPMTLIPEEMSFEEAATITTGGINGLHFLRKGEVGDGDRVLINGAGGSIGTYALQVAKVMGAEVTCVDSQSKLDMLTSLGADHVIDYQNEDFTESNQQYDVIIDVAGKCPYNRSVRILKPHGRFVLGNPPVAGMLKSFWTGWTTNKKVLWEFAADKIEVLDYIKGLMVAGKVKSVIDRRYALDQLVEAHRYVEAGHKAGNVVINLV